MVGNIKHFEFQIPLLDSTLADLYKAQLTLKNRRNRIEFAVCVGRVFQYRFALDTWLC